MSTTTSTAAAAELFESKHVHKVYEVIASHFSSTRYKAWPLVRAFVERLPRGSFLADIGCGNGKNLALSDDIVSVGCDYSASLLKIAAGQRFEVLRADGLRTPFRTSAFDAAISIAVIHHFATPKRRADAIAELMRIVKVGGLALIYVWAREQPRKRNAIAPAAAVASASPSSSFVKADTDDAKNSLAASASLQENAAAATSSTDNNSNTTTTTTTTLPIDEGDVLVPWEMHKNYDTNETMHSRYYHLFAKGELENLCQEYLTDVAVIVQSYYDKENWCVVLKRL